MNARSLTKQQEALINPERLTDGSTVYDVVMFDGNTRMIAHAVDEQSARTLRDALNDGCVGVDLDVIPQARTYADSIRHNSVDMLNTRLELIQRKLTACSEGELSIPTALEEIQEIADMTTQLPKPYRWGVKVGA